MVQRLKLQETTIVELKVKVDNLEPFRKKLKSLKAEYVGIFRQVDTYYEVPQGRLKLREIEGENGTQLVYYERPDVKGPKQSQVFIIELSKPQFMKQFFNKVLLTKTVIDKQRAIYRIEGTQVHLDKVKKLGTYVEFERPNENTSETTQKAHEKLEKLIQTLGIKPENLQKGSYSDLIMQKQHEKQELENKKNTTIVKHFEHSEQTTEAAPKNSLTQKIHNPFWKTLLRQSAMYDIIIIGSGPAGLTAAIYTSRAGLKTLVAAGAAWGGQLMLTAEVENFPGFKDGTLGPELMDNMYKQAERFGAEIIFEDASEVDFSMRPFKVKAGNNVYRGQSVIIATGASPKWLGLESEKRLRGRGVSVCATCDAVFFRDKVAVVVGGGDTALQEALELARFVNQVKIVHRRNQLRASKVLQERASKNTKIQFIWNSTVQEVLGENKVDGVRLKRTDTGEETTLKCDAVFVAVGHEPNTQVFKGQVELDEKGYVVAKDETRTSIEGVFVAGDVKDYHYRQAITAAGAGCKAALDVQRFLYETI